MTDTSEGKVGLEFPLDRHIGNTGDGKTAPGGSVSSSIEEKSCGGKQRYVDEGGLTAAPDAAEMAPSLPHADGEDVDSLGGGDGGKRTPGQGERATAGLQLRSEAPGATILLRARQKVPVVGSSGQRITVVSSTPASPPGGGTASAAAGTTPPPPSGVVQSATQGGDEVGQQTKPPTNMMLMMNEQPEPSGGLETPEAAARGETRDVVVHVYWDGLARDRAHVEVFPAERDRGQHLQPLLRLGVRVPTLAIVDAQAAIKFAERVVQQMAIQINDEKLRAWSKRGGAGQPQQQWGQRLQLVGVDEKSVVAGN